MENRSRWCLNRMSTSVLTMPFPTHAEAEIVRRSLESAEQHPGDAVLQEVAVFGNLLAMSVVQDPGWAVLQGG